MTPNPAPTVEQIAAMDDKLNVERLRELDAAATAGPWAYRPDEHDDWGLVKAAPYRPAGFEYDLRFVLAQFRDPNATDPITQHEHRAAKTDPWRGNAELVTYLRNAVPTILAMAEENARLREALGKMRTEAVLLLNNAEGCAANHYGSDFRMLGMPQWLLDARENIASASEPLRALANQDRQS